MLGRFAGQDADARAARHRGQEAAIAHTAITSAWLSPGRRRGLPPASRATSRQHHGYQAGSGVKANGGRSRITTGAPWAGRASAAMAATSRATGVVR